MRIRTYDQMSANVVRRAGGQAIDLPIGQVFELLQQDGLDGVLSSGDGAAGQRLGKFLHYFYDIRYATPISFTVMHGELYEGLSDECRRVIDEVAKRIEEELWCELPTRIRSNHSRMITDGVVFASADPRVIEALLQAGQEVSDQWKAEAPQDVVSILYK